MNLGYKLIGNAKYPQIAQDYERTFQVLKRLPCDIFLGAHGSYYGMEAKFARVKTVEATLGSIRTVTRLHPGAGGSLPGRVKETVRHEERKRPRDHPESKGSYEPTGCPFKLCLAELLMFTRQ